MATSITNQFIFGQKTATAGTAVELDTTEFGVKSVMLIAHSTNTGRVFYGGSDVASTTQKGLLAGESIVIATRDNEPFLLKSIFIDTAVTGEGVDFVAER